MSTLLSMEWRPRFKWPVSRFGAILGIFVLLYIIAVIAFIIVY